MAGGKGGRPRKPRHLHLVAGTYRPDRHGDLDTMAVPSAEPPEPPHWLSERAAEIFQGVAGIVAGMGMASRDHAAMLALLATTLEEVEIMTARLEDGGRFYETTTMTGARIRRPDPANALRRQAIGAAQSLLHEFGLSPAAISKVTAAPAPAVNPYAELG